MKNKGILSFGLFFALVAGFSSASIASNKYVEAYAYSNYDSATYYSNISSDLLGDDLLGSLRILNRSKRRTLIGYDSMTRYFATTDPGKTSGTVTAFYSGKSARYSGNMNREHVWPFSKLVINTGSRGQNDIENDMHMIRPAMQDDNSGRGNAFFTDPNGEGWDPGSLGDETYRGDAARIIFYCVVADSGLSLVDKDFDNKDNHTMGKLSTLLKWNIQYTVNSRENTRNEEVEGLQGNRNPFIDHPEYACRIWGKYNSDTEKICANYFKEPEIEIDYSQYRAKVGDSFTLTATITPNEYPDRRIIWESSDNNVVVVAQSGLVRAVGVGEANIIAYLGDKSKFAICHVFVRSDVPTDTTPTNTNSNSKICGGNIISTSVILSTLSILGISLILIKKKRSD